MSCEGLPVAKVIDHVSLLDKRQYAGKMSEIPDTAEKDYFVELIKYVTQNLKSFWDSATSKESESKRTKLLGPCCIIKGANKVTSTTETWFKHSGSTRKGVCLSSKKTFIVRGVKSKGMQVTCSVCLLKHWVLHHDYLLRRRQIFTSSVIQIKKIELFELSFPSVIFQSAEVFLVSRESCLSYRFTIHHNQGD